MGGYVFEILSTLSHAVMSNQRRGSLLGFIFRWVAPPLQLSGGAFIRFGVYGSPVICRWRELAIIGDLWYLGYFTPTAVIC
jgi:hypothetical protein